MSNKNEDKKFHIEIDEEIKSFNNVELDLYNIAKKITKESVLFTLYVDEAERTKERFKMHSSVCGNRKLMSEALTHLLLKDETMVSVVLNALLKYFDIELEDNENHNSFNKVVTKFKNLQIDNKTLAMIDLTAPRGEANKTKLGLSGRGGELVNIIKHALETDEEFNQLILKAFADNLLKKMANR